MPIDDLGESFGEEECCDISSRMGDRTEEESRRGGEGLIGAELSRR